MVEDESGRTADEPVKTSNLSVTDYFRQKMREKMLARQAATSAHGEAPEEPKYSLANVKEEKKVTIGGVGWEGSKMTFDEVKVELEENTAGDAGLKEETIDVKVEREDPVVKVEIDIEAGPSEGMDEKAAKKARKEAKRLKKLEGGVKAERLSPEPVDGSAVEEDAKAKREKKEKKEKKRRQSEGGVEGEKKRKRDEAGDDEVKVKKEKKEKKVKKERED